jgi:glutamyl-tRNA synthetase
MTTRTRIAPSPTGEDIHIGNLYTALINYAVAHKNDGQFIIRIEDTDRLRYQEGAEKRILSSVKAFGLQYDEGPDIGGPYEPYRQSERLDVYKKYALELIEKGAAYYCTCTKERLQELKDQQIREKKQTRYDKYCLSKASEVAKQVEEGLTYVIRLNVKPGKTVSFTDLIRGEISIKTDEIDDQVLLKSDGYPTYHLGVVIDDHLMKITHIIRAEEWIPSTPKHVLLYESFGWDLPFFAHVPILRNPDKSKLSKRKNAVWASWYLQEGFLPEAVLNYLALMGWSHPDEKEIFELQEYISVFDLKDVNPAGPIFDITKLRWMNQQYIQNTADEELLKKLIEFYPYLHEKRELVRKLLPLLKTRMETLKDFEVLAGHFFTDFSVMARDDKENEIAKKLIERLTPVQQWEKDEIFSVFKEIMTEEKVRMPLFYYLFTGSEKGLPLPESLEVLGKKSSLERLQKPS